MIILGLKMKGETNEEFVKSMFGFGAGMFSGRTCGTLIGGVALISMYMGESKEDRENTERLTIEFADWFEKEFGSSACKDLRREDEAEMLDFCSDMIEKSFNHIMNMLTEEGIDIYQ